ncbi:unnamed protein product, partial [Trichobilharzia regenti]
GNEAGDNASDEKVASPTSEKQADGESDEDGTEGKFGWLFVQLGLHMVWNMLISVKPKIYADNLSEHLNGSNGEHVCEHQDESMRGIFLCSLLESNDGTEADPDKGDDTPADKESNGEASD